MVPDSYVGTDPQGDKFPQEDLRMLDGSAWSAGQKVEFPDGTTGTIEKLHTPNLESQHYGKVKVRKDSDGKITTRTIVSLRRADGAEAPSPTPDVTPTPETPPAPAAPATPPTPVAPNFVPEARIESGQVLSPDNDVLTLNGAMPEPGLTVTSVKDGFDGTIETIDADQTTAWIRTADGKLLGRPLNSLKAKEPPNPPAI